MGSAVHTIVGRVLWTENGKESIASSPSKKKRRKNRLRRSVPAEQLGAEPPQCPGPKTAPKGKKKGHTTWGGKRWGTLERGVVFTSEDYIRKRKADIEKRNIAGRKKKTKDCVRRACRSDWKPTSPILLPETFLKVKKTLTEGSPGCNLS